MTRKGHNFVVRQAHHCVASLLNLVVRLTTFAHHYVASLLVAGPGIAPGLEDYALVNLELPRVSDYIIILRRAQDVWRVVSTDSPCRAGIASVLTCKAGCPPI